MKIWPIKMSDALIFYALSLLIVCGGYVLGPCILAWADTEVGWGGQGFAGGPIVTRLVYWYGLLSPLINMMTKAKIQKQNKRINWIPLTKVSGYPSMF